MTTIATVLLSLLTLQAGQEPEARYRAAWRALEVDRNFAEAASALAALADDVAAPRAVRAQSLLALARCQQLLGKPQAALATLNRLTESFGELTELTRRANQMLTTLTGDRTRYLVGESIVNMGHYLDLDSGGMFSGRRSPSGATAEVIGVNQPTIAQLVGEGAVEDRSFAAAVPHWGAAKWYRVTTDEGRTAWVQSPTDRLCVVRYVTRLAGDGPVLPAPTAPFCVGSNGKIELRFVGNARYSRYRVERRAGTDGRYEPVAETNQTVYIDTDCENGVRYGYRITGLTADGDAGVPAMVQGTTASRGVVTAEVTLELGAAQRIDLLRGEVTDGPEWDLECRGTYRVDWQGVRPSALEDVSKPGQSFWSGWGSAWDGVSPFLARIRGGGIARCQITGEPTRGPLTLVITAYADAATLPPGPELSRADGGGANGPVVVNANAPAGWRVPSVHVRDLKSGATRTLQVERRSAIDREAESGQILEYTATAIDGHGRRTDESKLLVRLREGTMASGSFRFHFEQGFSFLTEELCPVAEADVVFASCAGGMSSITLKAPGGIANLENQRRGWSDVPTLFEQIIAVDPKQCRFAETAHGDDRDFGSDVFVLRTRRGGWVKLAITHRDESARAWTEYLATIDWVHNPDEPVFVETNDVEITEVAGFRLIDVDAVADVAPNPARVVVKAVTDGEIALTANQGVTFHDRKTVDRRRSDLWVEGNGRSRRLRSARGFVDVVDYLRRQQLTLPEDPVSQLFDQVTRFEPGRLEWRRSAKLSLEDLLLLVRTRLGGYALVHLTPSDDGQRLKYRHSTVDPKFRDVERERRIGALTIADDRAIHNADSQEVLFDRSQHSNYEKATYSFEHATRDGTDVTRNDWDIQLSHTAFHPRMVVDDMSWISDLGEVEWKEISPDLATGLRFALEVPAVKNHVYLVHTVDRETDFYALFRVVDLKPADQCTIEWLARPRDRVETSPGFEGARGIKPKVAALFDQLERQGGVVAGVGSYGYAKIDDALDAARYDDAQVAKPRRFRDFLDVVVATLGYGAIIDDKLLKRLPKVEPMPEVGTLFEAIERATRQARVQWRIRQDNRLEIDRFDR